jgi:DNA topoisomerase-3
MPGEWELKLNKMLKGEFSRQKLMEEIRNLTSHIISQVKSFETDATEPEAPFSPVAGKRFYSSPTAYISEDRKIRLRKILGGRMMAEDEIVALIEGKTLGPFSDFRSKKGKPFTASIRLVDNKIEFLFAESTSNLDLETIRQGEPLGRSPIDGTPVYETPIAYMSESALAGDDKNGLRISRIILDRQITAQHIRQMLEAGKTELITGFISKKKRPFDAYLLLSKSGKVTFEFPPRAPKKQQK